MISTSIANDPVAVFLYAVKSPESKRQYPRRFKMFLDFLGFGGTLGEQAKDFSLLTINTDNIILQKKVEELTEKSKDKEYIIRGRLAEKDRQIKELKNKQEEMEKKFQMIFSKIDGTKLG